MDINSLIVTDEGLAALDNGAWVRDIGGMPGLALKVRGLTSPDVQKAITAKQAALRAKNKGKPLEAEQLAKTMNEILAEQVLKDWEGIEDAGQPVAYDQALATKWITSRNGEKFASIVLRAAQMVDADANAFVEEAGKNSSPA
ncbi:hypothetical protein [Delftia sp. ZNC0008]|jgi:hypothetical protein|uniref:hypothetical protein n=1 Tax=Delftia sp. ZNC0008 TaxID=1339242 RepID=UPI000649110E|nr:hypothetical protein [Delftia sp. ZNC0008]